MKRLKALLHAREGDMYIMLLVIVFVLIAVGLLLGETLRVYSVRDVVEYEMSRAVNTALEDAMDDSWRRDKEGVLDLDYARASFYEFLEVRLALDAGMNHRDTNGEVVWTLLLEPLDMAADPPRITARGEVRMQSLFGVFGGGEVVWGFEITSRNVRID